MTQMVERELKIGYEGIGSGVGEIWGATQANFLVTGGPWPGWREVAVMLNDPACEMLAEALGVENDAEFRANAARRIGEAAIRERYQRLGNIDAVVTVSGADLESHPELIDALRG